MRRKLRQGLLLAAATLVVGALGGTTAKADVILPAGFDFWQYTSTDPSGDPTWTTGGGTFDYTGSAPFSSGSYGDNTDFDYVIHDGTEWPINTRLWLRTQIFPNKPGHTLQSLDWFLAVDNGFTLYFNGNLVDSSNKGGYTERWEYDGQFDTNSVSSGDNWIAVALIDEGWYSAFDMKIEGSYIETTAAAPSPVPVPPAVALGALGMFAVAGIRRRSSASVA